MSEFFRKIYYLLHRKRLQRELEHDMAVHREMLGDNRNDFGNPAVLREEANAAWGWQWLDRFLQDLRFGARMLRRAPGVSLTAVAVLGLGIGVNVTAFSFVDAIFFRPLPVRDPGSLVRFSTIFKMGSSTNVPYAAAVFYREQSNVLASMIAQMRTQMTLSEEQTQSIHTALVTANYFTDLGVTAAYGRTFDPNSDGRPGAPPVAMLGYAFFERHFGGDPTVVNRTIRINGRPATVIGVVSSQFPGLDPDGADADDVWLPIEKITYFVPGSTALSSFEQSESGVRMYGRFKAGVSPKSGEQALLPLAQELVRQHPGVLHEGEHLRAGAGGFAAEFNPRDLPAFGMLAALAFLILAATCSNLGNLLLGHAVTREREIVIRLPLGATRVRILRQLVTESFLLATLGSAAALLLSSYASRVIMAIVIGRPGTLDVSLDWRTTAFCFGVGLIACILFGLPAARQLSTQQHRASRMRTFFMATQVAASCILLVLSALLVRGLERAVRSDPGFDYKHVIVLDPQLYAHSYSASAALSYTQELKERIRQAPGVEGAAVVRLAPLGNNLRVQRGTSASDGSTFDVFINEVDGDFLKSMGIPLLQGRTFSKGERDSVIVSESVARRLWPGKDPLQQLYLFNRKQLPVVGVSAEAHTMMVRDGNAGEVYMPIDQGKLMDSMVVIRTGQPAENFTALAASVARSLDPQLGPVVTTLRQSFEDKLGDSAKIAAVVSGMGMLALLLAVIGLYGVISYNVAQRTKEIGIRIALGASAYRVISGIISRFVVPLTMAASLGLLLAAALSFVLRDQLYGVGNLDPLSYVTAALVLGAIGSLAAVVPARRALRVDPIVALRAE
jgi:predicted permease